MERFFAECGRVGSVNAPVTWFVVEISEDGNSTHVAVSDLSEHQAKEIAADLNAGIVCVDSFHAAYPA